MLTEKEIIAIYRDTVDRYKASNIEWLEMIESQVPFREVQLKFIETEGIQAELKLLRNILQVN